MINLMKNIGHTAHSIQETAVAFIDELAKSLNMKQGEVIEHFVSIYGVQLYHEMQSRMSAKTDETAKRLADIQMFLDCDMIDEDIKNGKEDTFACAPEDE